MKSSIFLLLCCAMLFSCASQKSMQTEIPFEFQNPTCQKWVGGKEQSGAGISLQIPVRFQDGSAIEVKEVFFRGKQVPVVVSDKEGAKVITATISNTQPNSKETAALQLEPTTAVISYLENGELKYTKITGIKEKQLLLHNGRSKN